MAVIINEIEMVEPTSEPVPETAAETHPEAEELPQALSAKEFDDILCQRWQRLDRVRAT